MSRASSSASWIARFDDPRAWRPVRRASSVREVCDEWRRRASCTNRDATSRINIRRRNDGKSAVLVIRGTRYEEKKRGEDERREGRKQEK